MKMHHFHIAKATLFFFVYYLSVGAVWYFAEVNFSPLIASAITCLLAIPVLWIPSHICLKKNHIRSALMLGIFWCLCAIALDVILWVEPLGVLSGPLQIEFSAHEFYMDRYFPYIFITYGAIFLTPVLYVAVRRSPQA